MIISNDFLKVLVKLSTRISSNTCQVRNREKLLKGDEEHLQKHRANIIINGKIVNAFPLRLERKQECPFST